MKKTIANLVTLSLVVSACSPKEKVIVERIEKELPAKQEASQTQTTVPNKPAGVADEVTFQNVLDLTRNSYVNPNLAEVLYQNYFQQHAQNVKSWVSPLNESQLLDLQAQLKKRRDNLSYQMLVANSDVAKNTDFLASTTMNNLSSAEQGGAFANQVEVQLGVMAQSESLRKIFDILNKQMERNSASIARDVVKDLVKRNPQAIKEMDELINVDQQQRALAIVEMLKKYDRILAKYDFSDDGSKLIVYGLVAGALANTLKDNSTVQAILQRTEELRALKQKVDEIRLTVATLDECRRQLKKNWADVSSSFKAVKEDIEYYKDHGGFDAKNLDVSDRTKGELSRAMNDIMEGRFNKEAPDTMKGIFTEAHPLSDNVKNFLNSAAKTADSFNGIIGSVQVLSQQLGVTLSPELQDALSTASKIAQGVQLGSTIIQAYSAGGMVGALSAFAAGGPVGAALAAGSAMQQQAQNEAYFKAILKELGEIKRMQEETLKLQKETMQMVRDLAIMVDEYHKEDLFQMKQIYHQVVVNTEMTSILMQKDLRSCQLILAYVAQTNPATQDPYKLLTSIENLDGLRATMKDIYNVRTIQSLLTGSSEKDLDNCRNAMSDAFAVSADPASPLAARFHVKELEAQAEIERTLFAGALKYLNSNGASGKSLEAMALHLPIAKYDALSAKDYYVYRDRTVGTEYYERMKNLISPEALESHITALLALHSWISLKNDDLASNTNFVEAIVNSSSTVMPQSYSRSMMWLRGASEQIRAAIAQNALLAGEPILNKLAAQWNMIKDRDSECTQIADNDNYADMCFVRQNPLMMKNVLGYFMGQYLKNQQRRFSEAEFRKLVPVILGLPEGRFLTENGNYYLSLSKSKALRVQIPSYNEVLNGFVNYSESMPRLIRLQRLVADETAKMRVSFPLDFDAQALAKIHVMR